MPLTKLHPSTSPLLTDERLAQLRAILPEAFADGKINWDSLREALGETLEDDAQEHFGLFWPGKREARQLASLPSKGTLIPQPGQGVDEDATHNLFIEGDNLEVLKLFQKSYAGRVKLIYIDPPYNTGSDFIYSDDFTEPLEAYLRRTEQVNELGQVLTTNTRVSGRFHSNWLSMLFPRLLIARQLMREDGFIFVSIDDNEIHNLRQLMNEIFGEENFIAQFVWEKMYTTKNDASQASISHEYILFYAKNVDICDINLLPRTSEMDARYKNTDNDPRGVWKAIPMYAAGERKNGRYKITSPNGKTFEPTQNSHWRYREEDVLKLIAENRVYFGKDGNSAPNLKLFLTEVQQGVKVKTLWAHTEVGSNDSAKREMKLLFNDTDEVPFSFPKPTTLISRIIKIGTDKNTEDIVLDFFAGSSTTAHAIFDSNREDGGNRRFIMVQLPESTNQDSSAFKMGYKTISEISKERIRRTIKLITTQSKQQLNLTGKIDLGFRCLKLVHSHFSEWQAYTERDTPQLELRFTQAESPLVAGWTPENLLTEILILQGFPLDSRARPLAEFKSNRVLEITSEFCQHRLYICLDPKIQPETVQAFKLRPEDILVTLDSALSDEAKIRLADQVNLKVI